MIRKQVYIEPRQQELLKRRAKELQVTEAELFRRGLEVALTPRAPLAKDHRDWQAELAFIEERTKLPAEEKPRAWRREDLYADAVPG